MGVPAPIGVAASGRSPYYPFDQANYVVQGLLTAVGPGKPFPAWGPFDVEIWGDLVRTLTTTNGTLAASVNSGTTVAAGQAINSVNVPDGTTWATFSGSSGTLALPIYTYMGRTIAGQARIYDLARTTGLVGATVTGYGIPAGTTVLSIITAAVAPSGNSPGVLGVAELSAAVTAGPVNIIPLPFEFQLTANAIVTGVDAAADITGAAAMYSGTVQIERSFDGGATWLVCNIGGAGTLASYNAGTPVSLAFGEPERQVLYRVNCVAFSSGRINYRISTTGQAAKSLSVPTI